MHHHAGAKAFAANHAAGRGSILATNISLATININSIPNNGHLLINNILSKFSLAALQETKLRDHHQVAAMRFHLDKNLGSTSYFLATTDHRAELETSGAGRSGGVMTFVTSDFPGFADLRHLDHLDVVDRYHVLRTT